MIYVYIMCVRACVPLSELPRALVSRSLSGLPLDPRDRQSSPPSRLARAVPRRASLRRRPCEAARMRARDVAPPFAHTLAASAITGSDAPPMRRRGAAGAVPLYLLAASRQREVPDGARDLAVEQPTQKQSRHIGAETAHICPCAVHICPRTGHVGHCF